jgi:hypothetical protein
VESAFNARLAGRVAAALILAASVAGTRARPQAAIDGLIAFCEKALGSALLDKVPQLTRRGMQLMRQRLPE